MKLQNDLLNTKEGDILYLEEENKIAEIQIQNLSATYQSIVEENKKGTESCIYCLKPIEENDITKPFGVIGDFMCDHYTSNAFFQTIRKEYKKYYDKDLKLPEFDQIYYQPLDRKSIRIISCNRGARHHRVNCGFIYDPRSWYNKSEKREV